MNPSKFQPFSPQITSGQQNPFQINPTVSYKPTLPPANAPFDSNMPILNLAVKDLENISKININASFQNFTPTEQFASVLKAPPVQLPGVSSVTPAAPFQPAVTTPVSTPVSFQPGLAPIQPAASPVSFQPGLAPFQPAASPVSFQPGLAPFQPAASPVSFQPGLAQSQPAAAPGLFQSAGTTSPIKTEKMTTGSSGFVPQKFSPQVSTFQPSTFQPSPSSLPAMDKPVIVSGVNIPQGPVLNVIPSAPTIGLGTPIMLNIVEPEIKPMSLPEPPKSPLAEPEGVILSSPILSPSKFGQVNLPSEVVGTPLRSVSRPQIQSLPTAEAFTSQQKSVVGKIDIDLARVSGGRGPAASKFYIVSELKQFLKDLGLPSGGKKQELADRLHQHFTKQ